jgi:hypothetical protein
MQANGTHTFFFYDRFLHVVFKGELIQSVAVHASHMWLMSDRLITAHLDDGFVNVTVWFWCSTTGNIIQCKKPPRVLFDAEFAGLCGNALVLCSGLGHEQWIDVHDLHNTTSVIVNDTHGVAYQVYKTIWPEKYRNSIIWHRPESDPTPDNEPYFLNDQYHWRSKSLGVRDIAISPHAIWGTNFKLKKRLRSWSRINPSCRLPQLCVLEKNIPEMLFRRLYQLLWV